MSYPMPTSGIGEVLSYPKETLHKLGFQAKRRCRVAWADRYNWANYFFYNTDTQSYNYFIAEGIPTQSMVGSIVIEPDENTRLTTGADFDGQAVYGKAIMTLVFESAGFDLDNVFIEELIPRMSSESVTNYVQRGSRWMPISDVIHIPGYTYVVTYPRRATMPSAPAYLPGLINLDIVVGKMFPIWFNQGTLLYSGAHCQVAAHYDGTIRFTVSHNMAYRPVSWNYVWDGAAGGWVAPRYSKFASTVFAGFL